MYDFLHFPQIIAIILDDSFKLQRYSTFGKMIKYVVVHNAMRKQRNIFLSVLDHKCSQCSVLKYLKSAIEYINILNFFFKRFAILALI